MIQKKLNAVNDLKALERLAAPAYRNAYLESQVCTWIAYQIRALRKKAGLSQARMAQRLDKSQSVVSRLEDENYGRLSVATLLEVAKAMDVALLIQFVSYPDFLDRTRDKSERAMQPDTIQESAEILRRRETMLQFQQSDSSPRSRKNSVSALTATETHFQKSYSTQVTTFGSPPSAQLRGILQ
ncbi:helix-turn-helix domain-containing protein [Hoeflea sp.]|uniref:helix-turn-helix domain-containing protein n=1 Tax=Hoeflea sp. TaxID=1940281 RepID=UPI003B016F89